jgi:hypothetical protein
MRLYAPNVRSIVTCYGAGASIIVKILDLPV